MNSLEYEGEEQLANQLTDFSNVQSSQWEVFVVPGFFQTSKERPRVGLNEGRATSEKPYLYFFSPLPTLSTLWEPRTRLIITWWNPVPGMRKRKCSGLLAVDCKHLLLLGIQYLDTLYSPIFKLFHNSHYELLFWVLVPPVERKKRQSSRCY